MDPQYYDWTCSVCTFTWLVNSTGVDPNLTREQAAYVIGYPECVNPTYGMMSTDCMIRALAQYGLRAQAGYFTFGQALSICRKFTGAINPQGMYHFMAVRGIDQDTIWVANSAQGYKNIYNNLNEFDYSMLGPTQLIWISGYI